MHRSRHKRYRENKKAKVDELETTVKDLEEQLRQAQEAPKRAPEVVKFERERDLMIQKLSRLEDRVAKSKSLIAALTEKSTVISTLDTLLEKKGAGEKKGFELMVDAVNGTKQTCPGVSNDLLVGFAQNFFPGAITNNGKLVGLPEGESCERFRAVECSGSIDESQCSHCQKLMQFISRRKFGYFQEGNLGVYTPIQQEAMKEAKAEAIPKLSDDATPDCRNLISKLINLVNSGRLSPKSFLFLFMFTQVVNLEKARKSLSFFAAKISNSNSS